MTLKNKSLEEKLYDIDIDVYQALEEIPKDGNNAVFYIRASDLKRDNIKVTFNIIGENSGATQTVVQAMMLKEKIAHIILESALNFFIYNPDGLDEFMEHLKNVKDGNVEEDN